MRRQTAQHRAAIGLHVGQGQGQDLARHILQMHADPARHGLGQRVAPAFGAVINAGVKAIGLAHQRAFGRPAGYADHPGRPARPGDLARCAAHRARRRVDQHHISVRHFGELRHPRPGRQARHAEGRKEDRRRQGARRDHPDVAFQRGGVFAPARGHHVHHRAFRNRAAALFHHAHAMAGDRIAHRFRRRLAHMPAAKARAYIRVHGHMAQPHQHPALGTFRARCLDQGEISRLRNTVERRAKHGLLHGGAHGGGPDGLAEFVRTIYRGSSAPRQGVASGGRWLKVCKARCRTPHLYPPLREGRGGFDAERHSGHRSAWLTGINAAVTGSSPPFMGERVG